MDRRSYSAPVSSSTPSFSLGREAGSDGGFARQDSAFRSTDVEPVAGRYHLYVCYACPWASRAIVARQLTGTQDAIGMSLVDPIRDDRGWRFTGGEYVDQAEGREFLMEHYKATDPSFSARASVPVLWDTEEHRIVNNESGDIMRLFSTGLRELATTDVDLWPEPLRDDIDALNERLYDDLNNAVYKAGFTTSQQIYEREVESVFRLLGELEERLGSQRFLFGDAPVESDWRLFTTLVRFDAVYYIHFKCSKRRLVDHPNLLRLVNDLLAVPGIAETVRLDEIRAHYYRTHPMINPSGLVAALPDLGFSA
jgi:putative glutathione S-transferase